MLNIAVIMGRLTAAPELRTTPNGVSVTSFSVAVDRSYSSRSGGERQTDFINVVAWRGTAEFICKYFQKGQMIAIDGSIQTRNYEDKQGNKRTAVEVVANNANFCGSKRDSGTGDSEFYGGSYGGSFSEPRGAMEPAAPKEPAQAFANGDSDDLSDVFAADDVDDLPF